MVLECREVDYISCIIHYVEICLSVLEKKKEDAKKRVV